jgi:quercetin dioxygenase-like cupin family protein
MEPVSGTEGATKEVLVGAEDGAHRFALRRFTLAAGGRIPAHRHSTMEHEQLMLSGEMVVEIEGEARTVRAGDALFLPAGLSHGYENPFAAPAVFLCAVPLVTDDEVEWLGGAS